MGKRVDPKAKYEERIKKQRELLEEFAVQEIEWAGDLIRWYKVLKKEMPENEYRACVFFLNREFASYPGSLTLLYYMSERCYKELPQVTKETAFYHLAYRFKMYAEVLRTGGYYGEPDW